MTELVELYVEYGCSSETADFCSIIVRIDGRKIIEELSWLKRAIFVFRKKRRIQYPFSYEGKRQFLSDLNSKRISV